MKTTAQFKLSSTPELRSAAIAAAEEVGLSLAEYLRRAMIHLVNTRKSPFTERSGAKIGRPSTESAAS